MRRQPVAAIMSRCHSRIQAGGSLEPVGAADVSRRGSRGLRFATYLAPCNRPLYEFVAEACGAAELIDGGDWQELATGDIDAAFVCSPPLIWLGGAVEAIAAPVLAGERFGGEPLYSSDVVVRSDAPFRSLADLRGARWAINESSSWSGYWVTLQRVRSWSFFSEVVTAGFHQRALRMVAEREVDAAAIDCHVLAVESCADPDLAAQLRVVATLGPAPSQPVVVRSDLDPALKSELRRRLLALPADSLRRFLVERFAPAPDYSAVAAVVGGHPGPRLRGAPAADGTG
jgi:phosphonate transport system substrate-binding protein